MNKLRKLLILVLLSCSVYFIYNFTNNKTIIINTYGDSFQTGIDSFGIKNNGYLDYYEMYLKENHQRVILEREIDEYLSINSFLEEIKENPKIKKQLMNSNYLILSLGYNDLITALTHEEKITSKNYNKIISNISNSYQILITEIKKYHKKDIIVVGYYKSNKDNYYLNKGIRDLNNILKSNDQVTYIDTYNLLSNRSKYFSNPKNNYPNREAYQLIADKIIRKTLEK